MADHPRCGGPTCYLKGEVRAAPGCCCAWLGPLSALLGPAASHLPRPPGVQASLLTCQRNAEGVVAGRRNPITGTPLLCSVVKPDLIVSAPFVQVPAAL